MIQMYMDFEDKNNTLSQKRRESGQSMKTNDTKSPQSIKLKCVLGRELPSEPAIPNPLDCQPSSCHNSSRSN